MSVITMTEEQFAIEANWQMPKIKVGEHVVYFMQWNDTQKRALAFVTRASHRSVELLCIGADGRQILMVDVLHKDDPRLVHNVNLQRNGAWDYSDLEKRVQALESAAKSDVRPVVETEETSVSETVVVPSRSPRGSRKPMSEEARANARARLQAYHERKRQEKLNRQANIETAGE